MPQDRLAVPVVGSTRSSSGNFSEMHVWIMVAALSDSNTKGNRRRKQQFDIFASKKMSAANKNMRINTYAAVELLGTLAARSNFAQQNGIVSF